MSTTSLKNGNKVSPAPNSDGTKSVIPVARAKYKPRVKLSKADQAIARASAVKAIIGAQAKKFVYIDEPGTGLDPYVVAAATMSNVLVGLRSLAEVKPITRDELQVACDALLVDAGIEEFELPMGGTSFRRNAA